MTPPSSPAKAGDLVVIRRVGDGSGSMRTVPLTRWYVGRATKVKEGWVREFEYPAIGGWARQEVDSLVWGSRGVGLDPANGIFVLKAGRVDVDAVLDAVRRHSYDGHPNQPRPFDELDEARELIERFRA